MLLTIPLEEAQIYYQKYLVSPSYCVHNAIRAIIFRSSPLAPNRFASVKYPRPVNADGGLKTHVPIFFKLVSQLSRQHCKVMVENG